LAHMTSGYNGVLDDDVKQFAFFMKALN